MPTFWAITSALAFWHGPRRMWRVHVEKVCPPGSSASLLPLTRALTSVVGAVEPADSPHPLPSPTTLVTNKHIPSLALPELPSRKTDLRGR
jgi:hypothetical protein